jgi:hypothetical protein
MCSILWCILYTWESLGCMFSNLSLDSCIGNKGGGRWRKVALHPYNVSQESRGSLYISFAFFAFGGVVYCTNSVWPTLVIDLASFGGTGLTGFGNRPDWFVPRVGTCSGGVCICARGAFVCFGGMCSLLEHSFVLDVSSRCPCLRGPRLLFFKWSCSSPFFTFQSLVGVSFYSFLFFSFSLLLPSVCVVNTLIKGKIDNVVWTDS